MKLTILLLFISVIGYSQREITGSGITISKDIDAQNYNAVTLIGKEYKQDHILVTFIPTLQDYIKAYEADCNSTVLDTIQVCGIVKYSYVPVYEKDVVIHYKAVAIDTVWSKPYTRAFKYDDPEVSYISVVSSGINYSTFGNVDTTTEVCKDYIYETKKRKVYAFSEDFWNFVKNYKTQ